MLTYTIYIDGVCKSYYQQRFTWQTSLNNNGMIQYLKKTFFNHPREDIYYILVYFRGILRVSRPYEIPKVNFKLNDK